MNSDSQPNKLVGSLYYPTKRADFWTSLSDSSILDSPPDELGNGWYTFSVTPIEDWIENDPSIIGSPTYKFWMREGGHGRVLLLSNRLELVERFLLEVGLPDWIKNTPKVDIPGLMHDLMDTPRRTIYTIGAIYGRVSGFRGAIRTIILYGNDIADASLFRDSVSKWLEPYRINLRYSKSYEVMGISEDASISVNYRGRETFDEVDKAIRVIGMQLGRLEWDEG